MKPLILLALLLPLAAGAQVQKCTIKGKTVYSDSLCGQSGVTVNTDANNLDTSGLRALAAKREQKEADQAAAAAARPRSKKSGPCDSITYAGASPTPEEASRMKNCLRKAAKDMRR